MSKTIINLEANRQRPVMQCMGIDTLVDSGAVISVCNVSTEVFEILFEIKDKQPGSITGYGGECKGYNYIVKSLDIGDITFKNVPFFVPNEHYSEEVLIIAGTVFADYAYEIDMRNHILTLKN